MSTLTERVARAIAAEDGHDPDATIPAADDTPHPAWHWYRGQARAAIREVRAERRENGIDPPPAEEQQP